MLFLFPLFVSCAVKLRMSVFNKRIFYSKNTYRYASDLAMSLIDWEFVHSETHKVLKLEAENTRKIEICL